MNDSKEYFSFSEQEELIWIWIIFFNPKKKKGHPLVLTKVSIQNLFAYPISDHMLHSW